MKYLAIIALFALGACAGITPIGQKANVIKGVALKVGAAEMDSAMDTGRGLICNYSTYRAEMAARTRWNIKRETFREFCGRVDDVGR